MVAILALKEKLKVPHQVIITFAALITISTYCSNILVSKITLLTPRIETIHIVAELGACSSHIGAMVGGGGGGGAYVYRGKKCTYMRTIQNANLMVIIIWAAVPLSTWRHCQAGGLGPDCGRY